MSANGTEQHAFQDAFPKPVPTFNLSQLSDSRSQTLHCLLRRAHAELALLREPNLFFHTHMAHILGSSYYLGATSEQLQKIYEAEAASLKPIESIAIKDDLTEENWRGFLKKKEYTAAFTRFFDKELAKNKSDWKKVLSEFLYASPAPLVNGLCGGLGHPFIQLAYAYEFECSEVATEALSLGCTEYDYIHRFLDNPPPDTSVYKSGSFRDILSRVRGDQRLDGYFDQPGFGNIDTILQNREDAILEHWNSWALDDYTKQFEDAYVDAVWLAIGTAEPSMGYDFFLAHVLTVAHALRILIPLVPRAHRVAVFRQYWFWTLLVYVAQLRRPVNKELIDSVDTKGRDWEWVRERTLVGKWSLDSHYVKVIRALRVAAETWPDKDPFFLKAAIKYVSEFDGWTGFGPGME